MEEAAVHEASDGGGVFAIVLGFAAVDGFHGECVAEDEVDAFAFAQIREPVPSEHALAADYDSVAV